MTFYFTVGLTFIHIEGLLRTIMKKKKRKGRKSFVNTLHFGYF